MMVEEGRMAEDLLVRINSKPRSFEKGRLARSHGWEGGNEIRRKGKK